MNAFQYYENLAASIENRGLDTNNILLFTPLGVEDTMSMMPWAFLDGGHEVRSEVLLDPDFAKNYFLSGISMIPSSESGEVFFTASITYCRKGERLGNSYNMKMDTQEAATYCNHLLKMGILASQGGAVLTNLKPIIIRSKSARSVV